MSRKKPIEIRVEDTIEVWPDGVFLGKVTKSGNGAMISFYKKFLGQEVVIIVRDEMKKDEDILPSV